MTLKINIGCGVKPTKGWRNYDNSWSIRLARKPILTAILAKVGFFTHQQQKFIEFAKKENIFWADAKKHIPEENASVDVIYSSHMVEHLDKEEVVAFLEEARRILRSGGIIRIAVPDIKFNVENYLKDGDADKFIGSTLLVNKKPKTIMNKIGYLIIGHRGHQWMYDGNSLCNLLSSVGFKDAMVVKAGFTNISDPGMLDLNERVQGSVFVEAFNH